MNYQYFEKEIKQGKNFSKEEINLFAKLPLHQQQGLFKFSCQLENLTMAQAFEKRMASDSVFLSKLLAELICDYPQKTPDMLNWLFSFKQFPDPDLMQKKFKSMLLNQKPDIWDSVFANCPFNSKKLYQMITVCVEKELVIALDWLMDKHKKKYLPFHHDMYYWGIYQSFIHKKSTGKIFLERIVSFFPNELAAIQEKMIKPYYSLQDFPQLMINNNSTFKDFFKELELQGLHYKLDNNLLNQEKKKRSKI